ncbi:phage terminase large subunit family protein [Streptomyces sp. NPDC101490]|uniref:phage terminase large subunit family protein n=1 Tax=Streptomyces sp. NPDC101490 TaxID=3366143 RepID=UPI003805C812
MPWQQYVANVSLEVADCGTRFRYSSVLVSVPRQAGKTTLLRPVMTHRCQMVPDASTWLTAQKRMDARDLWMTTVRHVERSPLGAVTTTRRANGSEGLFFPGGAELRLFAPTEDALHSKTTDLVAVDEMWSFGADVGRMLLQAIDPTQATRQWAQIWYVSTAGNGRSTWMRPMVERCRAELADKQQGETAFFEWGIPEDTEDLTDLAVYAAHHPAVGHTISPDVLRRSQGRMDASEFARAYGNYWVSSASFFLAPAVWERGRAWAPLAGPVAFGVEQTPDGSGASVVAAGTLPDGRRAVELVEQRTGVGWLVPRLLELVQRHRPAAVVVDPYGPARSAHKALSEQHRVPVPLADPFTAADLIQAHDEFITSLVEGTVAHRSHARLDAALLCATSRQVREQQVISRVSTTEGEHPAALIAAMLALYGQAHPPEAGARPQVGSSTA